MVKLVSITSSGSSLSPKLLQSDWAIKLLFSYSRSYLKHCLTKSLFLQSAPRVYLGHLSLKHPSTGNSCKNCNKKIVSKNEQCLESSKYIMFLAAMLDETNLSSNMAAKTTMQLNTTKCHNSC